jgi:hypothetical protein
MVFLRYNPYLRLFFLIFLGSIIGYKYFHKNNYGSMIIQGKIHNQDVKGILVHNYLNKKNYILVKTIQNLEKNDSFSVDAKSSPLKKYFPMGFIHGYYIFPTDLTPKTIYYYHRGHKHNKYQYIKIDKQGKIHESGDESSGGIANLIIKNNKLYGLAMGYKTKKNFMTFNFIFKQLPLEFLKKKGIDGIIENNHYKNILPNKYLRGEIINDINLNQDTVELTIQNKKIHNISLKVTDNAIEPKNYKYQLSCYLHNQTNFQIYYYQPLGMILKQINGDLYIVKGAFIGQVLKIDDVNMNTIGDFIKATTKKKFTIDILYGKQKKMYQGIRNYKNCFITQWNPIVPINNIN